MIEKMINHGHSCTFINTYIYDLLVLKRVENSIGYNVCTSIDIDNNYW